MLAIHFPVVCVSLLAVGGFTLGLFSGAWLGFVLYHFQFGCVPVGLVSPFILVVLMLLADWLRQLWTGQSVYPCAQ